MPNLKTYQPNAELDLILERIVEIPKERIWQAWTTPELVVQWFTPAPWQTIACEIDLRPGGKFYTLLRSPEGQDFPNTGCFLDIIENEKLVWTNALLPGFRPANKDPQGFQFTAMVELESHPKGTKYTATVIHSDEEGCQQHSKMGFHEGWGIALDQLITTVKKF